MTNPYQSPTASNDTGPTYSEAELAELRERVRRRIRWPRVGLMVASGIGALWTGFLAIVFSVLYLTQAVGAEEGLYSNVGNGVFAFYYGAMGVAYFNVPKLRAYRSTLILAVVAIIPCFSPGFILGIPFGIWFLIALLQPRTIEAFERRA